MENLDFTLRDMVVNLDRIATALEESNKMMQDLGGYHAHEERA